MVHNVNPVPLRADIAQLVEQRIRNAKVVGSTPIIGTSFLTFPTLTSRDIHLDIAIAAIFVFKSFQALPHKTMKRIISFQLNLLFTCSSLHARDK